MGDGKVNPLGSGRAREEAQLEAETACHWVEGLRVGRPARTYGTWGRKGKEERGSNPLCHAEQPETYTRDIMDGQGAGMMLHLFNSDDSMRKGSAHKEIYLAEVT